jgi:hypothetical protein
LACSPYESDNAVSELVLHTIAIFSISFCGLMGHGSRRMAQ